MKQFEVILKNETVRVMAINLTVAILVPIAVNTLIPIVRPVAKKILKTGLHACEKAQKGVSELGEFIEDLVAEVQEEMHEKQASASGLIKPKSSNNSQAKS